MAVEARHLCLFPPQILPNRVTIDGMMMEGNGGNSMYGGGGGRPTGYGPLSGTTTTTDNTASLIPPPPPMYGTASDSIAVKAAMKSDSGLTYSIPVPRKRSRDNADQQLPSSFPFPQNSNRGGSFTFLGQDISLEIQQQQFEIDRFIAQQTAKVKMEMEERRKSYSRRIITAVEETVRKKLRAKEEEIEKIGRLNWALEEKVKSLCVENQIWRELAQSNEATANALRNNLEQVLLAQQQATHVTGDPQNNQNDPTAAALLDDAQSCCGSNNSNPMEENGKNGGGATGNSPPNDIEMNKRKKDGGGSGGRWCRNCGREEASVLLLPCRHLCACGGCGPSLHTCPVCLCTKNGTLHVNLSTSS